MCKVNVNATDSEKIVAKIKKILELSKNNPSEEEAKAAVLKAQKLMAEYHVTFAEIDGLEDSDTINEETVSVGMGNKWKYQLAGIVSKNFRCKHFLYGKANIVFYGYSVDTKIASETFKYLFTIGNKAANNYYQKKRNESMKRCGNFYGNGIKNCFLTGFLNGISEVLDMQCTALMIVTPPEVTESFKEKTSSWKKSVYKPLNTTSYYGYGGGMDAFSEGHRAGKNAIGNRKIGME